MKNFEWGDEREAKIDELLNQAGVPEVNQPFARASAHLPSEERNLQLAGMIEIDPDFKETADRIRSFFSEYDKTHPRSEVVEKASVEKHPRPATEIERSPDVPKEVDPATKKGFENALRDFDKVWEQNYGTPADIATEKPVVGPAASGEKPASVEETNIEEKKRDERFSEASTELEEQKKRSPSNQSLVNAIDLLREARDKPIQDAVRQVVDAQARDHKISKYQAAVILHALIPDQFAKPEVADMGSGEPGQDIPEMSVEQMANEWEGPDLKSAGKPMPGYPEGYVPRKKTSVSVEEPVTAVAGGTVVEQAASKESLEDWEQEFGKSMLQGVAPENEENIRKALATFRKESSKRLPLSILLEDFKGDPAVARRYAELWEAKYGKSSVPTAEKVPEVTVPAEGNKSEQGSVAVPFMITRDMEQQLSDLGWGPKDHGGLTPQRAHEIIKNGEVNPARAARGTSEVPVVAESKKEQDNAREEKKAEPPKSKEVGGGHEGPPKGPEGPSDYIPPEERPGWREWTKETASRLADRFGAKNFYDWARIAYNKPFIDWHTSRAVKLKGKLIDRQRTISELEVGKRHLQDEFSVFNKEGDISGGALMGIEKDRVKTEKDIEKNKNKANRLQSKLEYRNNQRARYENHRDEICRGFIARIDERLNPFEAKLSDFKMAKGQLGKEIDYYSGLRKECQGQIEQLEIKVEKEKQFPSLRRANREKIKKIERTAKDLTDEIAVREKDRGKIDKKITKQDKKAWPWRDKRDKLAMMTNLKGPGTSVHVRQREEVSLETRDVRGYPRREGKDDDGDSAGEVSRGGGENAPRPRFPEFEKIYSGEDLMGKWNSIYGSRIMINPETARKSFPSLFTEPHSIAEFEDFVGFYGERHGDDERFEGMPSMQKAARKKRTWWKRIFGRSNKRKTQTRLFEALNQKK